MPELTLNVTRLIPVAQRSNQEHTEPLTWGGEPMPILHLNARSRYITTEEILAIFEEETNR